MSLPRYLSGDRIDVDDNVEVSIVGKGKDAKTVKVKGRVSHVDPARGVACVRVWWPGRSELPPLYFDPACLTYIDNQEEHEDESDLA
jgi:hypothetical protein